MKDIRKQKVLFLCTGNSARSQMAEALLKHRAGDSYEVYSAGTHPETIDVRTIDTLSKFGLDTEQLTSKNVSVFAGQIFDYVITLCDNASNECRSYANALKQLAWDFPDPKERSDHNPFVTTLNELNNRLSLFLLVEINKINESSTDQNNLAVLNSDPLSDFSVISFYKSLSDDIRLKTIMLTNYYGELCVCELMAAMAEDSQPKVSRNLSVLKKAKVITDRKHGQWVFYRINPALPLWAKTVIAQTTENNIFLINGELQRLDNMQNRPNRASFGK